MKKMTIEELSAMPHDTLCRLAEEGKISWSEWIDAQPENYAGYDTWLKENDYKRSDMAARMFIRKCEEDFLNTETSSQINESSLALEELRHKI